MTQLIRDFIESDRTKYIAMSEDFYQTDAVLHSISAENFQQTFDECLKKNLYLRGLALIQEGNVAGYALLSFTWSNEAGGISLLIDEAYITPRYQGQGLGSLLFKFVEDEYKNIAKRIRLEVTSSNSSAIRLYKRLGYEEFRYLQMLKDL